MVRACGCALLFDIVNVQTLDGQPYNRARINPPDPQRIARPFVHFKCAILARFPIFHF